MFFFLPLEIRQARAPAIYPVANVALITLNVLVFLLGGFWAVGRGSGLPSILLHGFSHANFWHLLLNMWALWVFGNPVNRRLGNGLYLLVYLATIVIIGLVSWRLLPGGACGASGALFAVIIVCLMLMPAAVLDFAYLALFPLTLLIGIFSRPRYGIYWFVRGGQFDVRALWALALIPLWELALFFCCGWSWTHLAHLMGMLCGVAAVLMLPRKITMRGRAMAETV
jgi:membrane associated rhomboid family serine protease